MQQVFPQVYVFAVRDPFLKDGQNIVVAGSNSPERLDMNDSKWRSSPHQIVREIAGHYVATERMSLNKYPILTDDYAPVDYLASKVLPKR